MIDPCEDIGFPALAALGESFDRLSSWALLLVLGAVRRGEDGLAGVVAIRHGNENTLSGDFEKWATQVNEIQYRHLHEGGAAINEYLIAYEGRWIIEYVGEQRAAFFECQTRWMPEPIRVRVDLLKDKAGVWYLDDKPQAHQPAAWSVRGPVNPRDEAAECGRLVKERAVVRQEYELVTAESKHYKRVDNDDTSHPKFGPWHLRIQQIQERIRAIERKIAMIDDKIPGDLMRSVRDPEPEPIEHLASEKARLTDLAELTRPYCWRHLWASGGLGQRLKAMATTDAELLSHKQVINRIEAASNVRELIVTEGELKGLQSSPPYPESWGLRMQLDQAINTLTYAKSTLAKSKEFVAQIAQETLDDETYVAGVVAELEERIMTKQQEELSLKKRLRELEQELG